MCKKCVLIMTLFCLFGFAGPALAAPPFGAPWMISYDGYLQGVYGTGAWTSVSADTLIVVTNSHPSRNAGVWIEVFDGAGNPVGLGKTLYAYNGTGTTPLAGNILPPNAFGWITLSDIVKRTTVDPWNIASGEKFSYRIYFAPADFPPVVEVKQVAYTLPTEFPLEMIWNTESFSSWTETSLGGLSGTGMIKAP